MSAATPAGRFYNAGGRDYPPFLGHHPPFAAAARPTVGSDCGSSSGLGGMKDGRGLLEGHSDDSASINDSAADELPGVDEGKEQTSSSKQSAASSSGKGSSTGTSPTGKSTSSRSPKRQTARHCPPPPRLQYGRQQQVSKTSSYSSGPSTSSTTISHGVPTPDYFQQNGGGGGDPATSYSAPMPETMPHNLFTGGGDPSMPPGPGAYHHHHHQQQRHSMMAPPPSASPLPVYTMTVESSAQFGLMSESPPPQQQPSTSRPYPVPLALAFHLNQMAAAAAASPANGGGGAAATTTTTGGGGAGVRPLDEVSQPPPPPVVHGDGGDGDSAGGPMLSGAAAGPLAGHNLPTIGHHAVFVHVNPGETLSVRVGADIQHIPGPATVRMVSANGLPPAPLPLHVPVGHMVQQIVDEQGHLRHLILSPQFPPVAPPAVNAPVGLPALPGGQMGAFGAPPFGVGPPAASPPPPPPPVQMVAPPPPQPPPPHPFMSAAPDGAVPYGRTPRWSPTPPPKMRPASRPAGAVSPIAADVNDDGSRSSNTDQEEERDKLMEMLGRVQPPQIVDTRSRDAQVAWQALDTSEASASGGPFPYIDASQFSYEILCIESRPENPAFRTDRLVKEPHSLEGLKPDTYYFVRLRASLTDWSLTGNASAPVGFRTKPSHPDKPAAPRQLKRGKNFIHLQWRRPCDNGAKILKFHLEMADEASADQGDGEPAFVEVYGDLGEQFRVSKLEPSSVYAFRLAARNEHGASEWSDRRLYQTSGGAPLPPEPPQLLQTRPDSLQLCWQKRDNDLRFVLQMEDPSSGYGFLAVSTPTNETTTSVTSLERNTDYRFRLIAENDDGASQPSVAIAFRTLPACPQPPNKPYLKDRVKSTAMRLAWDPPKDSGGASVESYQLELCADGPARKWQQAYAGPKQDFLVGGLEPGQAYLFRLCCSGPGGMSGFCEPMEVCTTPVAPAAPAAPELVGKAKPNALHVKWGAPSSCGGSELKGYNLSAGLCDEEGAEVVYNGLKTDYVLGALLPGRKYRLRVCALNHVGAGAWSGWAEATTAAGPPQPPAAPRLLADAAATALSLGWSAPDHCNGAPVTEYRLLRAVKRVPSSQQPAVEPPVDSGTPEDEEKTASVQQQSTSVAECDFGDFKQVFAGSALANDVKNLSPACGYAFKVQAVNAAGESALSEALVCATLPSAPDAPGRPHVEAVGTDALVVSWDAASDNGAPLLHYLVDCAPSSSAATDAADARQVAADEHSITLRELWAETAYRVRVQAVNGLGGGAWSATVKATTYSRPPPPPLLDLIAATHNSIKLRWADVKQAQPNETYTYSLEVENQRGSFSPVYEGPNRSHKVLRLAESSAYGFRVRATSPTGGAGDWSAPLVLRTCRAPPPPLKTAPRVTEVGAGSWQVEWPQVKMAGLPQGDKLHYQLQLQLAAPHRPAAAVSGATNDEWKTVYQGPSQNYTLSNVPAGRVRVAAVRLSSVEEVEPQSPLVETPGSSTTPVTFSAAVQRRVSTNEAELDADDLCDEELEGARHRLSERQLGAIFLSGFALVALIVALLVQHFFPAAAAS